MTAVCWRYRLVVVVAIFDYFHQNTAFYALDTSFVELVDYSVDKIRVSPSTRNWLSALHGASMMCLI